MGFHSLKTNFRQVKSFLSTESNVVNRNVLSSVWNKGLHMLGQSEIPKLMPQLGKKLGKGFINQGSVMSFHVIHDFYNILISKEKFKFFVTDHCEKFNS